MADLYERDDEGNVTGKRAAELPQEPAEMIVKEPKPQKSSDPSTLASRAARRAGRKVDVKETDPRPNSTLASRAAERQKAAAKRIGTAENKAVSNASKKK